jgi:hypothetical protein
MSPNIHNILNVDNCLLSNIAYFLVDSKLDSFYLIFLWFLWNVLFETMKLLDFHYLCNTNDSNYFSFFGHLVFRHSEHDQSHHFRQHLFQAIEDWKINKFKKNVSTGFCWTSYRVQSKERRTENFLLFFWSAQDPIKMKTQHVGN